MTEPECVGQSDARSVRVLWLHTCRGPWCLGHMTYLVHREHTVGDEEGYGSDKTDGDSKIVQVGTPLKHSNTLTTALEDCDHCNGGPHDHSSRPHNHINGPHDQSSMYGQIITAADNTTHPQHWTT